MAESSGTIVQAAERAIREPGVDDAPAFARRVQQLTLIYPTLFLVSLIGIGLILWQGKFFVALAQRSNVETLVLAFLVVFFAYVAVLSWSGALGAARVMYYALRGRFAADPLSGERRKQLALGRRPLGPASVVAINRAVEKAGAPCAPVEFPVADAAGSLGRIVVDGVALRHTDAPGGGSNDLLAYFVRQVARCLADRGAHDADDRLDIVWWQTTDDEGAAQYISLARFARNLERHLGADELWPKLVLTEADCVTLHRSLTEVCPALRDESFLPDWEYSAEHKLPVVPEPLGLVSLTRSERRVDPVASMGCAVFVVLALVAILALFIVIPPWVPGT